MQDQNVIKLTEQDAVLLEQAASMLEGLENDERNRGNCSTAEGAGCSAHAVRRLASALLAHEREIGQCLHQIAETTHPTACTVEEVRAFEAAAAPGAVAVPDERAAFEAWFLQKGSAHQLERNEAKGWYENAWANAGWEAWQARAALAAAPAAAKAIDLDSLTMPNNPHSAAGDPERHVAWAQGAGAVFGTVQDAIAAASAAPVVLPEPMSPAHIQALHLARRTLYAIAKTYDDSELRKRALEADEAIDRLLAGASATACFVPAAAYDRLQALCDSQAERLLAIDDAVPVHWRAVLDPEQVPLQLKTSMHVVGFRDQHSAESWIAERLDFDGWRYSLEPLYAAPQAPAADALDAALSQAARDVLAERARQISAEGYDAAHDDEHVNDEIAALAALFIMPEAARDWDASSTGYGKTLADAMLPWNWAMPNLGDRRRQLVKGAAMVIAELERIDRAAISAQATPKEGTQKS